MEFNNITILGGGVLGTQIAMQSAYCGKEVTLWLRGKSSIKRTEPKLERLEKVYLKMARHMKSGKKDAFCGGIAESYDSFNYEEAVRKIKDAKNHIHIELDLKKAVKGADIVIESISENKKLKIQLFKNLSKVLEKDTLLVTNSSSYLPSVFMDYTGRPERFLALHFANNIWQQNMTEVMRTEKTSDRSFQDAIDFSKSINMEPMKVNKEKEGYVLNTLVIPLLSNALDLLVDGVASPEDIDKSWRLGTGAKYGPLEIYDIVGLETGYNIVKRYTWLPKFIAPYNFKGQEALLKKYVESGKTGVNAGEGFFKYDADGNRIED